MLTEADAKTKWCPMARAALEAPDGLITGFIPTNRHEFGLPAVCLCIGSACMAWRTSHRERGPIVERIKALPSSRRPAGENWGHEQTDPSSASKGGDWVRYEPGSLVGWCGAFGRPE